MTNPTPHGQVPEALIDLIDAYAETRHRYGGIYNAKTEAARKAVIEDLREALSGVQALSAGPADVEDAIAWLVTWNGGEHTYAHAHASELPAVTQARVMGGTVTPCVAALTAPPTPPAEQTVDPDGEAFRTAARLGLTLRFYGSCAQSSIPGTPSAYVVTHGSDRAEAMRDAVKQAAAIIASGGEAPIAPLAPPAEQQAAPRAEPGEPSDAEIDAFLDSPAGITWVIASNRERYRLLVRAILAKWGTQPQAGAVPQRWKAVPVNPTPEMWKAAKSVPDPNPPYPPHYGLVWDAMLAASPTPPAEQQAAPKAAPSDPDDHQILAITTAYEQGVGKGRQAHSSGKEIANPYGTGYRCDLAWQYGYKEGKKQQAAPKAAPGEPGDPDDSLLLCASDLQHSAIYDNHAEMQACIRAIAERIKAFAAPKAAPGEPGWWRKRADEIEAQVALTGSPEAMRCYTDMRTLLQAAAEAAPQQEAQEPATVPYQKLTNEIDQILSDPDTELSIGAKRALLWVRTWVSVPLWTTPQPAPAPLSDLLPVIKGAGVTGGYVVVTPAGWCANKAEVLRDAILSVFPVNPAYTPKPDAALATQGGK